mmetsp:Transcript_33868/g.66028  ORF Transcript_33868/g.66028 Transcript_33868/m.66028 type:complete len:332 (-) Transcript_33868:150-1145(-)
MEYLLCHQRAQAGPQRLIRSITASMVMFALENCVGLMSTSVFTDEESHWAREVFPFKYNFLLLVWLSVAAGLTISTSTSVESTALTTAATVFGAGGVITTSILMVTIVHHMRAKKPQKKTKQRQLIDAMKAATLDDDDAMTLEEFQVKAEGWKVPYIFALTGMKIFSLLFAALGLGLGIRQVMKDYDPDDLPNLARLNSLGGANGLICNAIATTASLALIKFCAAIERELSSSSVTEFGHWVCDKAADIIPVFIELAVGSQDLFTGDFDTLSIAAWVTISICFLQVYLVGTHPTFKVSKELYAYFFGEVKRGALHKADKTMRKAASRLVKV